MSNRFHNKWHRHNHHTNATVNEADSSYDPIASPSDPFNGSFILNGSLSASAPTEAYAGVFQSSNTALCAIGSTGIYARGASQDTGNIMISTWQADPVYPDVSQPAIYVDGSVVVTKAISANSLWVTQLYSVSSIVNVTDMSITELSGFNIKGTDYGSSVPTTFDKNTQQGLILDGVGLTGSSWGAFNGDIQTHRNLRVDGVSYVSSDGYIGNNLYTSGVGFFEHGAVVTSGNINVSGDIYTTTGNSPRWNTIYSTVTTNSATWNGGFCNNTVYLKSVSACAGTMSLTGSLTFAHDTSAITFTNRVSTTLTSPTSTAWLIVNVAGKDRAILLYNFN